MSPKRTTLMSFGSAVRFMSVFRQSCRSIAVGREPSKLARHVFREAGFGASKFVPHIGVPSHAKWCKAIR